MSSKLKVQRKLKKNKNNKKGEEKKGLASNKKGSILIISGA